MYKYFYKYIITSYKTTPQLYMQNFIGMSSKSKHERIRLNLRSYGWLDITLAIYI